MIHSLHVSRQGLNTSDVSEIPLLIVLKEKNSFLGRKGISEVFLFLSRKMLFSAEEGLSMEEECLPLVEESLFWGEECLFLAEE